MKLFDTFSRDIPISHGAIGDTRSLSACMKDPSLFILNSYTPNACSTSCALNVEPITNNLIPGQVYISSSSKTMLVSGECVPCKRYALLSFNGDSFTIEKELNSKYTEHVAEVSSRLAVRELLSFIEPVLLEKLSMSKPRTDCESMVPFYCSPYEDSMLKARIVDIAKKIKEKEV